MAGIGKSTETARFVVSGCVGLRGLQGKGKAAANGSGFSFGGDGNVLKLFVMIVVQC